MLTEPGDDCLFPCWWGLIPGETRIVDARNYLNSFDSIAWSSWNRTTIQILQSQNSYITIDVSYEPKDEAIGWLRVIIQRYVKPTWGQDMSDLISYGDWLVTKITKPYSLPRVLSMFGQPAEVLIFTQKFTDMRMLNPMSLVVFYPDRGFMIEYVMATTYVGTYPNHSIRGCPYQAFPNYLFWEPLEKIVRNDVLSIIPRFKIYPSARNLVDSFISLEEATGMSIEEFITLFKGDENACITTPAEIWLTPSY